MEFKPNHFRHSLRESRCLGLELETFQGSLHRETQQGEVNKEQIWGLLVLPGMVAASLEQKGNADHLYLSTILPNLVSLLTRQICVDLKNTFFVFASNTNQLFVGAKVLCTHVKFVINDRSQSAHLYQCLGK